MQFSQEQVYQAKASLMHSNRASITRPLWLSFPIFQQLSNQGTNNIDLLQPTLAFPQPIFAFQATTHLDHDYTQTHITVIFNGKFPFPPSREAWEISLPGISREFPGNFPRFGDFPGNFPGNFPYLGNFPWLGNFSCLGKFPYLGNFPRYGKFPSHGKFPKLRNSRGPEISCLFPGKWETPGNFPPEAFR